LPNPARSISQAADSLRPSPAGQDGYAVPGANLASNPASPARSSTGLVKKDPALQVSGSAASTTMPLLRRSRSTASRTSASGATSPTARASSAYRCGPDLSLAVSANTTRSSTYRSVCLNSESR
jgi:hypothetical protein